MEVDSFDIFRVCETKVWADPEYFVLGSLSGDRRIKTQPSKCRVEVEETPTRRLAPLGQIGNQAFEFLVLSIL